VEEQLIIKKEDFIWWYTPAPGLVLIEKDVPGERMGRLHLPRGVRDMGAKYAGTGVIRKMSPFKIEREPYDLELAEIYKAGQRVAFSNTTPFDVSLPAFCTFEHSVKDKTLLVLLHIADIFGVIDIPVDRLETKLEVVGG